MADLIKVVEGLDLVVEMADGVVHPDDVAVARAAAGRARDRRGYLGGTLVIGIIGGTGSGKSSLLNALAGRRVTSVSPVRPHTSRPLAWVPEDAEPGLGFLLDRLGIAERVTHDRFPGIALLDATDVDSVELGHRAQVEDLLPLVDAVIWVLDPDKYADPLLHEEFIEPLADSADQFLFVLNQVDRLAVADRVAVAEDLARRLVTDGIPDPIIFYTAADPIDGPVRGIDDLAAYLAGRLDAKRVQLNAVISEARRAGRNLAASAGLLGGGSLAFEERWKVVLADATTTLALAEEGSGAFDEVLVTLEDLVGHLASQAGGPFAFRIRSRFLPGVIETELRDAVAAVERQVPRGEAGVIEPERRADAAGLLSDRLQERIAGPLREILWERSALSASVAGLAVEAAQAEAKLRA
ncbi:MAG: 50S ribosome-binding GTPase [Acidimicrobiia bacterium]|nr:50S ribosome-binding GTPase [Acidimicrobiia bacterium]